MKTNLKLMEHSHPALFEAMYLIAADSGLPREHWEQDARWLPELDAMEAQAKMLKTLLSTDDIFDNDNGERETEYMGYPLTALTDFSVGEHSVQMALMDTHDLRRLSYFLGCFFGEYEWVKPGEENEVTA